MNVSFFDLNGKSFSTPKFVKNGIKLYNDIPDSKRLSLITSAKRLLSVKNKYPHECVIIIGNNISHDLMQMKHFYKIAKLPVILSTISYNFLNNEFNNVDLIKLSKNNFQQSKIICEFIISLGLGYITILYTENLYEWDIINSLHNYIYKYAGDRISIGVTIALMENDYSMYELSQTNCLLIIASVEEAKLVRYLQKIDPNENLTLVFADLITENNVFGKRRVYYVKSLNKLKKRVGEFRIKRNTIIDPDYYQTPYKIIYMNTKSIVFELYNNTQFQILYGRIINGFNVTSLPHLHQIDCMPLCKDGSKKINVNNVCSTCR
ncbi:hypothetical protein A3Q56_06291, partial [Intoshia linei]